jgi:uncharacterized protein YfaP (DUF2135 family)
MLTYKAIAIDPTPPLSVHVGPDTEAPVVGSLPLRTELTVIDETGGWLEISSPIAGWVQKDSTTVALLYAVNAPNSLLSVHVGPDAEAQVVGTLPHETLLIVADENPGGWLEISSPIAGWVEKTLIQSASIYVVNDSSPPLNIRFLPTKDSVLVGSLPNETQLTVVKDEAGWLRIIAPIVGWVAASKTRKP